MADAVAEDPEEFVVLSKVRVGHKREFEFALKSQCEINSSLGRTRARKRKTDEVVSEKKKKKEKKEKKEEEEVMSGKGKSGEVMDERDSKSDVVDAASDDENRSQSVESKVTGGGDGDGDGEVVRVDGRVVCGLEKTSAECDDENKSQSIENRMKGGGEVNAMVVCGLEQTNVGGRVTQERTEKRLTQSPAKGSLKGKEKLSIEDVRDSDANVESLPRVGKIKVRPAKLKDLLDTGLLEGLSVRYKRGPKMMGPGELGLRGVIKGCGILCYCGDCKGTKVITFTQYERHAGSSNKRPADYIYLENGNSLRDVINACKDARMDSLEVVIRHATGCSPERNSCTSSVDRNGSTSEVSFEQLMSLPNLIMGNEEKEAASTPTEDYGLLDADIAKKSSGSTTRPRVSATESQGRVTRKDLRLHKLVFEDDALPDGTELGYYNRGRLTLSGYKRGMGIFCMHCQEEVSPSQFEAHAGQEKRRKPYLHIYTSNGVSLHELSISLSRTRESSIDENDDLCGICFDVGELLCCDGCRRAFHAECISVQNIPPGKWYCKYCEDNFKREKLAEDNANAIAAGRVPGVDPLQQISKRCIRVVKTLDSEHTCCVLCRGQDFSRTGFGPRTVIICDQCEKEFHVGCLKSHNIQELKELPKGKWFCSFDCNRIHSALRQLLKIGEQEIPESLLDAINKKHEESGWENDNIQIKWRLLSGRFSCIDETRLLLSKAVSLFHERFDPILNPNSTQDLIPHMVYGRDVKDLELGGMYCAILSVNSTVVSAVVFRIFGKDVAEIPLVVTSSNFQGKGYFQALYACIESLLRDLEVNNLLLPATMEAKSLWTSKLGFSEIQREKFNDLTKNYNVLAFDGTAMLHKLVPKI